MRLPGTSSVAFSTGGWNGALASVCHTSTDVALPLLSWITAVRAACASLLIITTFSPLREALYAFVAHTQRHASGDVRLKLYKGTCRVVGRKSPEQLYRMELATYGRGDEFDQSAAAGFIKLWGQGVRTASQVQGQLLVERVVLVERQIPERDAESARRNV